MNDIKKKSVKSGRKFRYHQCWKDRISRNSKSSLIVNSCSEILFDVYVSNFDHKKTLCCMQEHFSAMLGEDVQTCMLFPVFYNWPAFPIIRGLILLNPHNGRFIFLWLIWFQLHVKFGNFCQNWSDLSYESVVDSCFHMKWNLFKQYIMITLSRYGVNKDSLCAIVSIRRLNPFLFDLTIAFFL